MGIRGDAPGPPGPASRSAIASQGIPQHNASRMSGEAKSKVLHTNFHPYQEGVSGGHTSYIRSIIESRLAGGFDFGVAAPEKSAVWRLGEQLKLPTYACDFPGNIKELFGMLRAVRRFDEIYRQWKPDLIHLNGSRDQTIVVWWKRWKHHPVPLVRGHLAVRCIPDHAYHRWSYNRMVARHIYLSHSAKNISQAGSFLKPPHSHVVLIGVDLDFWSPQPKDPVCLAKYGVAADDFVFGSHAGMGWHKRTDLFLKGAALARQHGCRPFKILLRGKEREVRNSQALAAQLGLDNVIYAQYEPDPRSYLSLIDVGFLLSEAIEAISFAARELMAMGKPMICTNYAGLVENVDDTLNGRLVECGNVEDVAEAIEWFLARTPVELEQLKRNARAKAEAVFGIERQCQGIEKVYRLALRGTA